MRKYCKAYHLGELRHFCNWTEKQESQDPELSDETIVYLWDDFTVVRSPMVSDKGVLFETVTPEWQTFCQEELRFVVPEDLQYTYTQAEGTSKAKE